MHESLLYIIIVRQIVSSSVESVTMQRGRGRELYFTNNVKMGRNLKRKTLNELEWGLDIGGLAYILENLTLSSPFASDFIEINSIIVVHISMIDILLIVIAIVKRNSVAWWGNMSIGIEVIVIILSEGLDVHTSFYSLLQTFGPHNIWRTGRIAYR